MKNLIIFTNVGWGTSATIMLVMARYADTIGDCRVLGVVCSGTPWNEASANYADWLMNPEFHEFIIAHRRTNLHPITDMYPRPLLHSRKEIGVHTFRELTRGLQEGDDLTLLLAAPLDGFSTFIKEHEDNLKRFDVNVVVLGDEAEDGIDPTSSYYLRASPNSTALLNLLLSSEAIRLNQAIPVKECARFPIFTRTGWGAIPPGGYFIPLDTDNRLLGHIRRLVVRNEQIIKEHCPDIYNELYDGNPPKQAIPYSAWMLWKTLYPTVDEDRFWRIFNNAIRYHPRR